MTKEEKLKILGDAEERAYKAISELDVTDERFGALICHIDSLRCALERLEYSNPSASDPYETTPHPAVVPEGCTKDSDPAEEPEPTTGDEPEPPTRDEVRKKLAAYQTSANLDVAALMQSMGYSKLSEVPASRYWELLELAQKTADGEG